MQADFANQELFKIIHTACRLQPINYARFIDLALYTPKFGYYKRNMPRVGRNAQCDFYTLKVWGLVLPNSS